MLGMEKKRARRLAYYTEAPDTKMHGEWVAEVQTTWSNREEQLATHALTSGLHSKEEFFTAFFFLRTEIGDSKYFKPNEKIRTQKELDEELGRLLHRYGDCYAHSRLEDGNEWFDKKRMYGRHVFPGIDYTLEHLSADFDKPDMIYMRGDFYLRYVTNLARLLAQRFGFDQTRLDMHVFQRMVRFAKQNRCSLIGIINYEIARIDNRNDFSIPYTRTNIYPATSISSFNMLAEVTQFMYDFGEVHKKQLEYTRKYLKENNVQFGEESIVFESKLLATKFEFK
jgi:hypothetical protein